MQKLLCSIENYISDNYSICREERQYALYLSNVLRKYNTPLKRAENENINRIFDVCWIPKTATIQHVFYEAAFMRDFFQRNRRIQFYFANVGGEEIREADFWEKSEYDRNSPICEKMNKKNSFNRKLFKYCCKELPVEDYLDALLEDIEEVHYGIKRNEQNEIPEIENLKKNLYLESSDAIADRLRMELREMMNSKPDIAVIYEDGEMRYLLFLECKFESSESTSNSGSTQTILQWKIADFLCKNHFFGDDEIYVSPKMADDKKSKIVMFTRKNDSSKIIIKNLIELEQKIFEQFWYDLDEAMHLKNDGYL